MTHDRIVARLDDFYAIGRDRLQVILFKRNNRVRESQKGTRQKQSFEGWHRQPTNFFPVSADVLRRRLWEIGVRPTPEGQTLLDSLPDDLRTWQPATAKNDDQT